MASPTDPRIVAEALNELADTVNTSLATEKTLSLHVQLSQSCCTLHRVKL